MNLAIRFPIAHVMKMKLKYQFRCTGEPFGIFRGAHPMLCNYLTACLIVPSNGIWIVRNYNNVNIVHLSDLIHRTATADRRVHHSSLHSRRPYYHPYPQSLQIDRPAKRLVNRPSASIYILLWSQRRHRVPILSLMDLLRERTIIGV